jgi:hypothetical protein
MVRTVFSPQVLRHLDHQLSGSFADGGLVTVSAV